VLLVSDTDESRTKHGTRPDIEPLPAVVDRKPLRLELSSICWQMPQIYSWDIDVSLGGDSLERYAADCIERSPKRIMSPYDFIETALKDLWIEGAIKPKRKWVVVMITGFNLLKHPHSLLRKRQRKLVARFAASQWKRCVFDAVPLFLQQ